MDYLNAGLDAVQSRLAWVATDPFDWPVLASHFKPEVFNQSQAYGKNKAKILGLYKQVVHSLVTRCGMVPWSWKAGGWIVSKLGYGSEY